MHHPKVNVEKLASSLKRAAGARPYAEIARSANIQASRVSKFLNGDFKAMTPSLERLCATLSVPPEKFLLNSPPSVFSAEMLNPLRRIVGNDPKKIRVANRFLRSLEALAVGARRQDTPGRRS